MFAILALATAGCARDPFSVDRQINEMVRAGTARVRASDEPVARPPGEDPTVRPASSLERSPATANPATTELTFRAAAPDRDVAARLADLANAQGVPEHGVIRAAGEVRRLTLADALAQGQRTGREVLSAQEEYLLAAIDVLIARHRWGPRLFNDTTATVSGRGDDGDFQHALEVVNRLRATKRLPFGGSIEAQWVWNATEQLREQASGRYRQSSELALSAEVPLLRGAGAVAQEDLIQAERDLIYAARSFERFRREYLVRIANDYFELLNAKSTIANQERQLESLRQNAQRTAARVEAERLPAFQRGIAENEVLSAEASLAGQRESYILRLERFKIRLGLPVGLVIDPADDEIDLPEPDVSLEEASRLALDLRLDLQNQRDRLDDRRRGVANARNALLPELNLSGRVGIPTDPDAREGGLAVSPDDLDYALVATLSLPLDRREERLRLRSAIIGLQQSQRDVEQRRDEIVVSVRSALRNVELARFQLRLAERAVDINRQRLRSQELQADTVDTQQIVDTQNALLASENQRDRATTNLRTAVLNYLLESDQLRVRRDGSLEPLRGAEPNPAR